MILKLLQHDPADRYQASFDLETDLRSVLGTLDVPARAQVGSRSRRRGLAIAAALALTVRSHAAQCDVADDARPVGRLDA